jgi:hypothetical protein
MTIRIYYYLSKSMMFSSVRMMDTCWLWIEIFLGRPLLFLFVSCVYLDGWSIISIYHMMTGIYETLDEFECRQRCETTIIS